MKKLDAAAWHPYIVLLYLSGVMFFTMLTWNPVLIAVSFLAAAVTGSILCGKKIWKSMLFLFVPVFVFAVGILPLFSHHGITPLFYVNAQAVTLESICYGIVMSLMLTDIFLWFQIAGMMLDGEKIMFLFGRVFPSLGLLMSMVFRMLPLFRSRFREIREARRGLNMPESDISFFMRCRQFGKELSILVSWSLESAIETSVSMESRGYGTGRRTSFHLFHFRKQDSFFAFLFLILFFPAFYRIGTGGFRTIYFPAFIMEEMTGFDYLGIFFFVLASLLPALERRRNHE